MKPFVATLIAAALVMTGRAASASSLAETSAAMSTHNTLAGTGAGPAAKARDTAVKKLASTPKSSLDAGGGSKSRGKAPARSRSGGGGSAKGWASGGTTSGKGCGWQAGGSWASARAKR